MARAKVHRKKVRSRGEFRAVEFSGEDLVRINIKTGEGFCRIREFWERERLDRLPENCKEAM